MAGEDLKEERTLLISKRYSDNQQRTQREDRTQEEARIQRE